VTTNCTIKVNSSGTQWPGLIVQGEITLTAYGEETRIAGPKMFILHSRGSVSGPFDLDDQRFTIRPTPK
jgi:hypothetical protein